MTVEERIEARRLADERLAAHFEDGGTITISYRLAGEEPVTIKNAGRKEWGGVLSLVARNYLRRGNIAEWPSYSFE